MQKSFDYLCEVEQGKPMETPIYRHPSCKNGMLPTQDSLVTVQQQLLTAFEQFQDKKQLGVFNEITQAYHYITYREILEISTAIGSSLCLQDSIKEISDNQNNIIKPVGINLSNNRECTIVYIACILFGFTTIPFLDSFNSETLTHLMNQTQTSLCFAEQKTAIVISQSELPYLQTIITIGQIDEKVTQQLLQNNKKLITWEQFLASGRANIQPYPTISLDQSTTLIFSSGSTGYPKSVLWKQSNFISLMFGLFQTNNQHMIDTDVYLAYIPVAHTSERLLQLEALLKGAQINYFSGNLANIILDIKRCRPTYFFSTPSLFIRIYDGIQNQLNQINEDDRGKFQKAVQLKLQYMKQTGKYQHEQLDQAFINTKLILGGRQRILGAFGAPISSQTLDYLKVTLCCQIMEGYGQTEVGCPFSTNQSDNISGHVGGPNISQEFKMVSVPDMNYFTDGRINGHIQGEICLRGPSVMNSYFNNPEQNLEVIDQDGWIHTGDIGEIVNGALYIIDRMNSFFKICNGYWISPLKIETCLLRIKGINEIFIFGDSYKEYVVAVVVPDQIYLQQLAINNGIEGDHNQFCQNKELRKQILQILTDQDKIAQIDEIKYIKNVYLESNSFGKIGILTETQKLQRHKAKQYYQNIIQDLYKELE